MLFVIEYIYFFRYSQFRQSRIHWKPGYKELILCWLEPHFLYYAFL